ncbi:unnamed protein product [Haemonchus placei]|uniref:Uncharacterized protein n=1 Tax=Haemonchus placei TaxID=6290 RepID=A0A0N4WZ08_HAEPC|nr:unnamed protein product [Haemonchus placei]
MKVQVWGKRVEQEIKLYTDCLLFCIIKQNLTFASSKEEFR